MSDAVMESRKVVVRSVGSATPAVSSALAQALPFAPTRLARCLYQAPAVLLDGLVDTQAQTIRDLLARTGLDVEVADSSQPVQEGGPEYELAVHVTDPARFRETAAEIARFIGCPPARAVELLCASPPVVLGQVSAATAQALADRMRPLGAEVDMSRVADARYDVFVSEGEADLRRRIVRQLQAAGVQAQPEGPLVALGIDRTAAELLWSRVGAGPHWRLVDQSLQRFDVVLDDAPDTDDAAQALAEVSGMPLTLVAKVRAAVPLVLLELVPGPRASQVLARLAQAGVTATARLVTMLSWDVVVREARDPAAAAGVLASILGQERRLMELALHRLPARIDAPLNLARGRWLAHELAGVGAQAVLEER